MRNALLKDTLRRISKTKGRFLAIMAIIAIGCGFFAGVKVTSPDMKHTADKYYHDYNLMDIHLISGIGFSEDEVAKLGETDDIRDICGGYSADMLIEMEDGTLPVTKVYSIDTADTENCISRPQIIEGRMPQSADECLIEADTPSVYAVGDTITLRSGDDSKHTDEILSVNTFKIVGKVSWVKYVDFERGTTTIGNGKIDSFLIVPNEAFAYECFTDVYINLESTADMDSFSDEYQERIDAMLDELDTMTEKIHHDRLSEMSDELADAEREIQQSEKELNDAQSEFDAQIADAEKQITDAEAQADQQEKDSSAGIEAFNESVRAYNSSYDELIRDRSQRNQMVNDINAAWNDVYKWQNLQNEVYAFVKEYADKVPEESDRNVWHKIGTFHELDTNDFFFSNSAQYYAFLEPDDPEKTAMADQLNSAAAGIYSRISEAQNYAYSLQSQMNSFSAEVDALDARLASEKAQLEAARPQYESASSLIAAAREEIEKKRAELEKEKANGQAELDKASAELEDGKRTYNNSKKAYDKFAADMKWYLLDRTSNNGYASFGDDADRVDSVAKVFPIFFILVAALVCLNTMTRMVEEQRTEIGTLKALGYRNGAIIAQFMFYAASASILGAVIGLLIGFNLFPRVIFNTYTLMYQYPDVICRFRWDYAAGCTAASLICTCTASYAACRRELAGQPAQLMRPKAPKDGRRVFLERIPFIWKHLSFNIKVTARNIFRYKKRVLMTVIGIGGCTALLLTGFGLRNAISVIVDLQYGEICRYDVLCTFSADSQGEADLLHTSITEDSNFTDTLFAMQKSITVKTDSGEKEAFAVVPEMPEKLNDFITLRSRTPETDADKRYTLSDDGVIINEKLAKLLDVGRGDTLSFADTDKQVKISAVTENYSQNYVYFTPSLYESIFGECEYNIFYADLPESYDKDSVSADILRNTQVMSVNFTDTAGDTFRKLVKNLNAIVYVIIGSSGALAFVVLYNLSNINITERMRELATIKVLGFHDREVTSYISRENVVSAILGMAAGLFAGIFLTHFVVQTAEVDVVMFCPDIPLYCFGAAALLTIIFTAAVNFLLSFKLRKIDMAASMKAVE